MKTMLDGINPYELAVEFVVAAPDIQFQFRMYPEVASARRVRIKGCDRVRALELVNGAWAIVGILESEAAAHVNPKVFFTLCESEQMKDAGMVAIFHHLMEGTMGEFLARTAEPVKG